ncbi:MAG: flagellar protein FlaG [SAR324 cluster bacterium]|nr:flagellar protein FlaG [SAR324 cluster bacterium]MCH8885932.1 flagellar protein FlaG [SAR324 cluster bacterium]
MKIFPNLDPKENRLPADTSGIIRKVKMKTPSIVNPDFFISNNPAIKANLKQFHPIDPAKVRLEAKARLASQVAEVNSHIQNSILFKGITFEVHEESGRTFAVVKNQRTGEVLKQIPGDKFLDRASRLKDAAGLFQDITI